VYGARTPSVYKLLFGVKDSAWGGYKIGRVQIRCLATAYIADGIRDRRMDLSMVDRFGNARYSISPIASIRSGCRVFLWVILFGVADFVALVECRDCLILPDILCSFHVSFALGVQSVGRFFVGIEVQGWLCDKKERKERKLTMGAG
jgi:hypothetical protein